MLGKSVEAIIDSDENINDSDCESLTMDQPDEPINEANDVTHAIVSDTDEDDNDSDNNTLDVQHVVNRS